MRVRFGGTWIADSEQVLLLFEPGRYPVAYFPLGDVPTPDEIGLSDVEPVTFETTDGLRLNGWFVAASGPPSPRITVLVFNGNAGAHEFWATAQTSRSWRSMISSRSFGSGVRV